ncbi:MAG: hypothetical protein ABDH63_01995 [Candidatus Caldarchaeales archaeon]
MGFRDLLLEVPLNGRRVVQFGFAGVAAESDVFRAIGREGELLVLVNSEKLRSKAEASLQGTGLRHRVVYSPVIEHNPELAPSSFDAALFLNALVSVRGKRELVNEAYRLLKAGSGAVVYECYWPTAFRLRRTLRSVLTERPVFRVRSMSVGLDTLTAVLEKA